MDAAGAEFHAVAACQLFERAFGHLIDGEHAAGLGDVAPAARDVDDAAVVAHVRDGGLDGEERAAGVDRHGPVEFALGHVGQGGAVADAGVVDEDVEGAEIFQGHGDEAADVGDFGHVGLDWEKYVKYDARYERPAEVELLIGDPAKAKAKLGWEPTTKFKDLVRIMV